MIVTPREREIMIEVARGRLSKQIAGDIGIAEATVKVHRSTAMRRYQTLAKDGFGSVQNAQQYTSQLHQQEAATAMEDLNRAERQVASLKAQRMSAEASLAQANAQLRQAQVNLERTRILSPVDGYVTNLLAQLERLREYRRKRHLGCRRQTSLPSA
jgi:multidrug resistance efflux pump